MNKKNKTIIGLTILIIIVIIVVSIILINRKNVLQKTIEHFNTTIINKIDCNTISGDLKAKINLKGLNTKNEIITDMDYKANYDIDLTKGFINLDGKVTYDKKTYDNNIYIKDYHLYIKTKDIYDKYVAYFIKDFNSLRASKELLNIVSTINDEIVNTIPKENYKTTTSKLNGKKVNKTVLKLNKNYKQVKETITNNLINNKDFVSDVAKYKNIPNKEAKKYIKDFNFKSYELILYTTKMGNEFIRFDIKVGEAEFNFSYKEEKLKFKYYLRDGLEYEGYIKIEKNKVTKINIQSIIEQWNLDIDIEENNVKYNEKIEDKHPVKTNNFIFEYELTENDKDKMKKNSSINDIYEKYSKRLNFKVKPAGDALGLTQEEDEEPVVFPHPKDHLKNNN